MIGPGSDKKHLKWAQYGVTQIQEWNLSSAILELVLASKVDFHGLAVASNNGDLLGKKWLNQIRK